MKKIPVIVWLPLVFIAGGIVGYYGPAEELRSRNVREQEAKAKPKNAFGSFTELVNIPEVAKRPRRVKDTEPATNTTTVVATADEQPEGTNATDGRPEETPEPQKRQGLSHLFLIARAE